MNVLTGMGTYKDKSQSTFVGNAWELGPTERIELAKDVFISRVCSAVPDAATAKGWEVTVGRGTDPEAIDRLNSYAASVGAETEEDELSDPIEIFSWAGYLANVHRGSAIVMNIDDGQPPDKPIALDRIKTISSLDVLDSEQICPDLTTSLNPHRVTHYTLLLGPGNESMLSQFSGQDRVRRVITSRGILSQYQIHKSRVLRIPGCRIPRDAMIQNNGWDRSLIEQIWEAFRDWKETGSTISALLKDYSIFSVKSPGFKEILTEGNETAIRNRIVTFRMMISLMGGMIMDKDEEVDFVTRQFGGIPDLWRQWMDIFVAAAGVPHSIILGEAPGSGLLGGEGSAEEKTWAKTVGEYQARVLHPRLRRLYRLMWLAKDGPTNGEEPETWDIKFNPLLEQTEEQKVGNRSQQSQIDNTYLSAGVLLPEEVRNSRFGGTEYSFETILNEEAWEAKKQQENQEFDFGGLDLGGGAAGALPAGEGEPIAEEGATEEPVDAGEAQLVQDSRFDSNQFTDESLHQKAVSEAKAKFKIYPSAYAGMWISKRYKQLYKEKHGSTKGAYQTRKDDTREWLKEEWVRISSNGTILGACGDRTEKEGKPKCLPKSKAQGMSKDARIAAVRKKRREDPDPERSGSAKMVATKPNS